MFRFFIPLLLSGCAALAPAPTESMFLEMCRDNPAEAKAMINTALADGWSYAGPAYNNGINCTDSIWIR